MRTFAQLTEEGKEAAIRYCLNRLLDDIVRGVVRLPDEKVQERIATVIEEVEANKTPWLVKEYIMEVAGNELQEIATREAETSVYLDVDDTNVIRMLDIKRWL